MPSADLMHRFLFDCADLRGEIVTLADSYAQVLKTRSYPQPVQQLLGEFLAAASLMSTILKFEGRLTLQAQGRGPLSMIVAECSHTQQLRAVAQCDDNADWDALSVASLAELIGAEGVLAIIIEPDQGARYQGLVPLDAGSLAACLERYFEQSEQLATRFWLAAEPTSGRAGGLLLQALPQQQASAEENQQRWETVCALADTVTGKEQLELPHEQLLHRLFHEQQVRLFEPSSVSFGCSCSFERSGRALVSLGYEQVKAMLDEQGGIDIDCQFCNQHYHFGETDVKALFPEHNTH